MSVRLVVNLEQSAADTLAQYSAGAKVYVLSATSQNGSYSDLTSAVITTSDQFEFYDAAGTSSTWYKSQVGNAAGNSRSSLSDAFQATSLAAYASVQDVVETTSLGSDTTRYNLLADLLSDVSTDIDASCGRQFYRSPQVSGTETFYLDVSVSGKRRLSFATRGAGCSDGKALDIISITTLQVRTSETSSYVTLVEGTDFYLEAGAGPGAAGTDWPYEDIVLLPNAQITYWPVGWHAVSVVGVRGFPKVPNAVKRAAVSEVRSRFRGSIAGSTSNDATTGASSTDDGDWLRVMFPPYVKRSWAAM